METKTITINELNDILAEVYGATNCSINKASVITLDDQSTPKNFKLGVGCGLTITFELE